MEKVCEFCTGFRAVVYCKSDAAHLCLSCDTRVHSANALSNRHLRSLLCDACRHRPASIQCFNHRMIICRGCDRNLHDTASQHRKLVIRSYVGCPSAKDFATMLGFDLDKLQGRSGSRIGESPATKRAYSAVPGEKFDVGLSSQIGKIYYEGQHLSDYYFILQQIFELKRLQITEGKDASALIRSSKRSNEILEPKHSGDLSKQTDHPDDETSVNMLASPFSQVMHLASSAIAGVSLHGESFWQCKSPSPSSQLWSQNMQDLGVCEDVVSNDDLNIPDVDLTFQNFEELFGADQDHKKNVSIESSEDGNTGAMEDSSLAYTTQEDQIVIDTGPPRFQVQDSSKSPNSDHPIQPPPYSSNSSFSNISMEDNDVDFLDRKLSPNTRGEASKGLPDLTGTQLESTRENLISRYKEKKKARRHENQTPFTARKSRTGVRKQRVKG